MGWLVLAYFIWATIYTYRRMVYICWKEDSEDKGYYLGFPVFFTLFGAIVAPALLFYSVYRTFVSPLMKKLNLDLVKYVGSRPLYDRPKKEKPARPEYDF